MKTFFLALAAGIFMAAAATESRAGSLLIGTPPSINGTSNSTPIVLDIYAPTNYALNVTYGGLASTNEVQILNQFSLDGTNFISYATNYPSSTNAGVYPYRPVLGTQPVYFRVSVITTNAVPVAVATQ